jgi:hypothetical protein
MEKQPLPYGFGGEVLRDEFGELSESALAATDDGPSYAPPSPAEKDALLRQFRERHKQRAGFTTNKGRGLPKAKRSMARQSRRVNRGK